MGYAPDDANSYFESERQPDYLEDLPLRDFIERTLEQFRADNGDAKLKRDGTAQEVFYAWLNIPLYDENEQGILEPVERQADEIFHTVPVFPAMLRMLQKEYLKSNPSFSYTRGNGTAETAARARVYSAIVNDYQGKFFTQSFHQRDTLAGFAFGFFAWEVRWKKDIGPDILDEIEGAEKEEVLPAESYCQTCGRTASADLDGEACPEEGCEGRMELQDPIEGIAGEDGEIEYLKAGDLYFRRLNQFGSNACTNAELFADSLWFSHDDIIDIAVARCEHPEADLRDGGALDSDMTHLRRQRSIERTVSGLGTSLDLARSTTEDLSIRERCRSRDWLDPKVYKLFKTKKGDTLPGGKPIPEGTSLAKLFPKGMRITRFGKEHVEYEGEDKNEAIVFGAYQENPNSLFGKSVGDCLTTVHALHETVTIIIQTAYENGVPTTYFDEALGDLPINAAAGLRVAAGKRPRGERMEDMIFQSKPGTVSDIVKSLPQMLKEDLQMGLGAFSPYGGSLPEAGENTATGMSIVAESASSQQALSLALRAEAMGRVMELSLRHFARNCDDKRAFRMAGPYDGGAMLEVVGKDDIDPDVRVVLRRNSFWPRELYQQQAADMQFTQALQMRVQTAMMMGETLDFEEELALAELYQIDIRRQKAEIADEMKMERIKKARDFFTRAGEVLKAPPDMRDFSTLAPDEISAIEQAEALIGQEQAEMMQQQLASQTRIDPATGAPAEPAPEEMAMVAQMAQQAMQIDPRQVLVRAATDFICQVRPELDPHSHMERAYGSWGLTWEGRNADFLLTQFVSLSKRAHAMLKSGAQAREVADQQGALQSAMAPVEEAANARALEQQIVSQAVMPQGPQAGTRKLPGGRPAQPGTPPRSQSQKTP